MQAQTPYRSMTNTQKKTMSKEQFTLPDPIALSQALMTAYQKAQPLFEKSLEQMDLSTVNFDPMNIRDSYLNYLDKIVQNPDKFMEIQAGFAQDWMHLWQTSVQNFMGDTHADTPSEKDRRFKSDAWNDSALFSFIKNSYLLTCRQLEASISDVDGLDEKQREKLRFQTKLFTDAMSPSNFAMTNPEVIEETLNSGGENLVKGFENLVKDLERGSGNLSISTTNYDAFTLGENIAVTPGKVVYQNDLMQLIQYEPQTKEVHKTPLLIVPPWINKYYILDLRAGKSYVEWAVQQGHTVFVISWANPDKALSEKSFEDYLNEGVLDALTQIENITEEAETNAVGYCLGGTLLAITCSYLAQKKQSSRVKSATFLTTLLDFEHAGDMKLFLDDEQLDYLDEMMDKAGVLSGKELQKTFSLMRSNDLIWSFVVNNYLMGKEPFPFDLLYWNDDCTNMPAAMHRFYLRNMYRDNKLAQAGGIEMNDTPIDLGAIDVPCHFISTKEDHIAPWIATYAGAKLAGSKNKTFTLSASGHIAGIVNPPAKDKYCYWTNKALPENSQDWDEKTKQHDGSWWPFWGEWIADFGGEKIKARKIGKALEDAPGSYVRAKV